jgi:hypothetical protein
MTIEDFRDRRAFRGRETTRSIDSDPFHLRRSKPMPTGATNCRIVEGRFEFQRHDRHTVDIPTERERQLHCHDDGTPRLMFSGALVAWALLVGLIGGYALGRWARIHWFGG